MRNLVHGFVGPGSSTGPLLISIGLPFATNDVTAYMLGFPGVILLIFLFGILAQSGLKIRLQAMGERFFRKVPLVGSLYHLTNRFIGIFQRQDGTDLKNMNPAVLEFDQIVGTTAEAEGLSVLQLVLPVDLGVDGADLVPGGFRMVAETRGLQHRLGVHEVHRSLVDGHGVP